MEDGGGVAAHVRAQCHRCLARWTDVRSQSCCDCCAGGGDVRCATFATDDLCACCADERGRVRCDMLEYARAQMSCIRVFYLSRVAGECIFNTQISRHTQPTRAFKIHCMPLAVAAHVDWRATHQLNPPRGSNAGGASSLGSTVEPDELRRRNPRPMSRPELCVGRQTGIERGGRPAWVPTKPKQPN